MFHLSRLLFSKLKMKNQQKIYEFQCGIDSCVHILRQTLLLLLFFTNFPVLLKWKNCTTFVKGETLIFDSYCFNSTIEKIFCHKVYAMLIKNLIWGNFFFACFKNEFNWLWFISFDYLNVIETRAGGFYLIVLIKFSK